MRFAVDIGRRVILLSGRDEDDYDKGVKIQDLSRRWLVPDEFFRYQNAVVRRGLVSDNRVGNGRRGVIRGRMLL